MLRFKELFQNVMWSVPCLHLNLQIHNLPSMLLLFFFILRLSQKQKMKTIKVIKLIMIIIKITHFSHLSLIMFAFLSFHFLK